MTAWDVVVVGAGAAGTFAALAARGAVAADGTIGRAAPEAPSVLLVDGQAEPGRKILISGGGRCNVTNAVVRPEDLETGSPAVVRSALREFGVPETRRAFASIGVELVEEAMGKLFPASGRARDVLAALRRALAMAGVVTRDGTPVGRLRPDGDGWAVDDLRTRRVVLATGGLSVPATGSTGFGLAVAAATGHELAPTAPALAALEGAGHPDLAGLAVPAVVAVLDGAGRELRRAAGSLLFTHAGASGPAALDVSVALERAGGPGAGQGDGVRVVADLWTLADRDGPMGPWLDRADGKLPGASLPDAPRRAQPDEVDRALLAADGGRSPTQALGRRLPRRLAAALVAELDGGQGHGGGDGRGDDARMGQLPRGQRRALAGLLAAMPLRVDRTAGYAKAEVTAGGVRLDQLHRRTLESRVTPGLHLCGEACDVTGRLGGFNFQWAWTSGVLAGRGAAAGR
jgi:predicted flavoprotein YhiN